ncbi:MAG: chorismate--pyruvate lyase [Lachnospiraceae bacterium]|nr:chorismate--pyruvate lyase [Lachnospiraceae bacterium]
MFEAIHYEVASIDGDYANLRNLETPNEELKVVARAILPPEIFEGCKIKYEMMSYSIE